MNASRTAAQHLASRHNLRQRHVTPLSERGQQIVERGRRERVELTPHNVEKRIERETAEGK